MCTTKAESHVTLLFFYLKTARNIVYCWCVRSAELKLSKRGAGLTARALGSGGRAACPGFTSKYKTFYSHVLQLLRRRSQACVQRSPSDILTCLLSFRLLWCFSPTPRLTCTQSTKTPQSLWELRVRDFAAQFGGREVSFIKI